MSYNPYPPVYGGYPGYGGYYPAPYGSSVGGYGIADNSPQARDAQAQAGVNTLHDPTADQDAQYRAWLGSQMGQDFTRAQESAAAYARQQADADMANKKRALDIQVAQLKQQGRQAEAELALKKGDQQISRDRLAQELKIHQDTFGLQQQQFGLDRAKTYADYASTPDRLFMLGDLNSMLQRAGQGLGPQPYGYDSNPTPKTMAGFDALSAPLPVAGQTSVPQTTGSNMLGSGQLGASTDASDGAAGTSGGLTSDPRTSAISSIVKASPPSDELGLDANDAAALGAIQNIIKLRRPGTLQQMRPGQQQAFLAGASRLGYYAPDVQADLTRSGIGQGGSPSAFG